MFYFYVTLKSNMFRLKNKKAASGKIEYEIKGFVKPHYFLVMLRPQLYNLRKTKKAEVC
jgi:hypothetical protein